MKSRLSEVLCRGWTCASSPPRMPSWAMGRKVSSLPSGTAWGPWRLPCHPCERDARTSGEILWHYLGQQLAADGREGLLPRPGAPQPEIAVWADLFYRGLRYPWPGNVRELVNWARQVALVSEAGLRLPAAVYAAIAGPETGGETREQETQETRAGPARSMAAVTEDEFQQACEDAAWEVASVARALGVSRQSVYRRIEATPGMLLAGDVTGEVLRAALESADGDLREAARRLRVSRSGLQARARQLGLARPPPALRGRRRGYPGRTLPDSPQDTSGRAGRRFSWATMIACAAGSPSRSIPCRRSARTSASFSGKRVSSRVSRTRGSCRFTM